MPDLRRPRVERIGEKSTLVHRSKHHHACPIIAAAVRLDFSPWQPFICLLLDLVQRALCSWRRSNGDT